MFIAHRITHRAKKAGLVFSLGALGLIAASAASAQVLDQVPSDAMAVLKINHVADTSAKLGSLMQALGITDFVPALNDPLGALQNQGNVTEGIDKAGDAAVVIANGAWGGAAAGNADGANSKGDAPPILVLIPVTDYKAFLGNITVTSTEGDITTGRFKNASNDSFVANWGTFAVVTPQKDLLSKKPDGLKVTGLSAKELTDKDAAIYVNMPAVKAKLLPLLQNNRDVISAQLDKLLGQAGAADKGPVVKLLVSRILDDAQEFIENSSASTLGLNISKAGVNGTLLDEFTPDSFWGKMSQQAQSTDGTLLNGLPAGKYMFFGGVTTNTARSGECFDHLIGDLPKQLAALGDTGSNVAALLNTYRDMITLAEHTSMGLVAPAGPGQGGLFQFVSIAKSPDANKLKSAQESQFKIQQDLMKSLGIKSAAMMTGSVKENAKTVDGVSFDLMQSVLAAPANTPEAMQMTQMMTIMYGGPGVNVYVGAVDPHTLIAVMGDDALLTKVVASAKSDADVLATTDTIKAVDAELPKKRVGAFYVPLDVIVSTAVTYARQFGFAMPVQLPPNLQPIGVTLGYDGAAVRVDGHVPTELVQSLIQASMQVYMQMHGGGGAAPNGAGGGL